MKELQLGDFTLDESTPFSPTTTLYLPKLGNPPSKTLVSKVIGDIPPISSLDQATEESNQIPILQIQQKSRFSRVFFFLDPAGAQVAELSGPLLSFGRWKLIFSDDSTHDIDMRPVGTGRRADIFVQDSVPYFWDVEGRLRRLFKVVGSTRVEVAQLTSKHTRDRSGVLAIDEGQVDVVIAVITAVGTLQRSESFRK